MESKNNFKLFHKLYSSFDIACLANLIPNKAPKIAKISFHTLPSKNNNDFHTMTIIEPNVENNFLIKDHKSFNKLTPPKRREPYVFQ